MAMISFGGCGMAGAQSRHASWNFGGQGQDEELRHTEAVESVKVLESGGLWFLLGTTLRRYST